MLVEDAYVRCYMDNQVDEENDKPKKPRAYLRPDNVLVFDTETRTDYKQAMTIAVFRLYELLGGGAILKKRWLVYNKEVLDPFDELETIESVISSGSPCPWNRDDENTPITVMEKDEFIRKVFKYQLRKKITLLGFNLPFDISRFACLTDYNRAGDGFIFWFATNPNNPDEPDRYIPGLEITTKAAYLTFYRVKSPTHAKGYTGKDVAEFKAGYVEFVDASTLSRALSGEGGRLDQCGKRWECDVRKSEADSYGHVTAEHIQYCENDVAATFSLYQKLIEELKHHPISRATSPAKLYSGASLTKAYWRTMGILKPPPFDSEYPNLPDRFSLNGDELEKEKALRQHLMEAFFAGRCECRIRKTKTPIVYCDFMSQYPTVATLMGLWSIFTAERYTAVECAQDTRQLLSDITLDDCFNPDNWPKFRRICRIRPNDDLLPVRCKYDEFSASPNIALAYLNHNSIDLWYTLPDLIASKLLTGRAPQVDEAYQIQQPNTRLMWWERNYDLKSPVEKPRPGIKAVKIRGAETALIEPGDDFFQKTINLRKQIQNSNELSETERERLGKALKIMANSGYGSFVEVNVKTGENAKFTIPTTGITAEIKNREDGGQFFFPPVGVFITAGGRLLLAMAQAAVHEAGLKHNGVEGHYAFMDTDSIGIVADEQSGTHVATSDVFNPLEGIIGIPTAPIVTLSWKQVDEILERFAALNPYPDLAGQSILEKEAENYAGKDEVPAVPLKKGNHWNDKQRQIYFYGIARKRYHIVTADNEMIGCGLEPKDEGTYDIEETVKLTEHGLGTLIPPYAILADIDHAEPVKLTLPEFAELAYRMARAGYGDDGVSFDAVKKRIETDGIIRLGERNFSRIYWERFALKEVRMQTPSLHKTFEPLNKDKGYDDQVKPFGFMEAFQPPSNLILEGYLGRGPFVRAGDDDRSKQEAQTGKYEPSFIDRSNPFTKQYYQRGDELPQIEVTNSGIDKMTRSELERLHITSELSLNLIKPISEHQTVIADNEVAAKTYLGVIRDYIRKGETPLEPSDGVGLLGHKKVLLIGRTYIGKESNRILERDAGVLTAKETNEAAPEFQLTVEAQDAPVLRGDMAAIKRLLCARNPLVPGGYWNNLEKHIGWDKLAAVIGVSEREVGHYLAEKRFPTDEGLNKLVYYLQTEVIPEFVRVRFNVHFDSVAARLKTRIFTSLIREYLEALSWELHFFDVRLKEWWCGYDLWVQENPNAPFLPATLSFPRRREQQAEFGLPPGTLLQNTPNIKKRAPGRNKAKKIDWYDRPDAGIRACDFGIQTVWTSPYGQEIWNKVKDRFEPKHEIERLSNDDLAKEMAELQGRLDRIQKIERAINNEPAQIITMRVRVEDRENYPKVVPAVGQTMKSVFITEEDDSLLGAKNNIMGMCADLNQEFLRRRSITEGQ